MQNGTLRVWRVQEVARPVLFCQHIDLVLDRCQELVLLRSVFGKTHDPDRSLSFQILDLDFEFLPSGNDLYFTVGSPKREHCRQAAFLVALSLVVLAATGVVLVWD